MREFKYLGVLFSSEGTMECGMGQKTREAEVVLHLLYCTVVTKKAETAGKAPTTQLWIST